METVLKTIALGAAALVLSGGVAAQSSPVTLYGLIDFGVEHVLGAQGQTRTGFGALASRWGVRGTEALGGGLRATFHLEGGFSANNGTVSNGNRHFGRWATVGLAGPWGEVKLGRQLTMLIPAMMDSDTFGPSWYGSGSLDSYLPNARADNAVSYQGKFGGLDVGATFSLGRDVVNNGGPTGTNCPGENGTCREASVMLRYRSKDWGLSYGHEYLQGGPGAVGGLTSGDLKDRRNVVGAYLMVHEAVKLSAGLMRRSNDGRPTDRYSDMAYVGGQYSFTTATSLDLQALRLSFKQSNKSTNSLVARVTHRLSKRSSLYAMASQVRNSATSTVTVSPRLASTPGMNQTGVILGMTHSF